MKMTATSATPSKSVARMRPLGVPVAVIVPMTGIETVPRPFPVFTSVTWAITSPDTLADTESPRPKAQNSLERVEAIPPRLSVAPPPFARSLGAGRCLGRALGF